MNRQQQRALAGQSKAPTGPRQETPAAWFEAGLRLLKAGQFAEAEQCGASALALDDGHADSLHLMGMLCLLSQRIDLAIEWFARAVLHVTDVATSVRFYVERLGFTNPWHHDEDGKPVVAQVDRQGCELILSAQWPEKVGKGLMFISLDVDVLDALRAELETRGVDSRCGRCGCGPRWDSSKRV